MGATLHLSTYYFLIIVTFAALSNSRKEGRDSFQATVEETYKKVVPCLRLGGTLSGRYPLKYAVDLEAHYFEMMNATSQFRGLPPHHGSGSYQGLLSSLLCLATMHSHFCTIDSFFERSALSQFDTLASHLQIK